METPDKTTEASQQETRASNTSNSLPKSRGVLADIILNAVEPGINQTVLVFLNIVFLLLLATLAGVSVFTGLNIHVIILGIIAIGLCVGFNLFISQLPSQAAAEEQPDPRPTKKDN